MCRLSWFNYCIQCNCFIFERPDNTSSIVETSAQVLIPYAKTESFDLQRMYLLPDEICQKDDQNIAVEAKLVNYVYGSIIHPAQVEAIISRDLVRVIHIR